MIGKFAPESVIGIVGSGATTVAASAAPKASSGGQRDRKSTLTEEEAERKTERESPEHVLRDDPLGG